MTQKFIVVGLASIMAFGAALAVPEGAKASSPDEQIVLRIGTQAPKGTPWGKLLLRMRSRISKLSNKRVKVKLYWLGKLGSENKLVRRCQKGTVDGIAVSVGAIGNAVPELNLIEVPYMFGSEQEAYRKLAKATPLVRELMGAKGMKFILWGENGFRHFMHKEKFLDSRSAMSGVKMRSQPSEPHKLMYRALGASASTIAIGELKQSLDNGVVQGFDNSYIYTYATGLHKEIKYVTESKHIYQPAVVAWCDKGVASKLAAYPELAKIMMDVPTSWEDEGRKAVRIMNTKIVPKQFEKSGIQIKRLGSTSALKNATRARVLSSLKLSAKGKQLLELLK